MKIGIIILAGGKSSRMGEDKGLMLLHEKPMIKHVIEVAKQITANITIITSNNSYNQFGYPISSDKHTNKGPLAGIYSGLINSLNDYNLILSCDIPYIKKDLLEHIIDQSENSDISMPIHLGRIHPLIGVYRKSCISHFKKQIEDGQLKLTEAIKGLNVNIIETEKFEDILFKNVNSKNDIA